MMMENVSRKQQSLSDLEISFCSYLEEKNPKRLEMVIQEGSRMVYHFARVYTGGISNEDIIQAGYEGLMKAVKRYDPYKGVSFVTYAGHYIMGEIRHYIRKEASYYRPGCITDLRYRIEEMVEKYFQCNGKLPTNQEIADFFNIRLESVNQVMKAGLVPIDEVQLSEINSQVYRSFQLPIEDRILLQQALHKLDILQRKVIYLLFFRDLTQQQAADALGLHQRKISRLLHKALEKLNEMIVGN